MHPGTAVVNFFETLKRIIQSHVDAPVIPDGLPAVDRSDGLLRHADPVVRNGKYRLILLLFKPQQNMKICAVL